MRRHLRPAFLLLVLLTVLTGGVYPALVTLAGRLLFPKQAAGSLVVRNGEILGSERIGQPFDDPRYFQGRPSATSPAPYDGAGSSGSNLGPTNPALADSIRARVARLRAANPAAPAAIPVDLVTASGSGLDPDISPAAAYWQVPRVAAARGIPEESVRGLVADHVEPRTFGVLGDPRVNVLRLNLALDARP
jgi:K+-transporting ATPase ATPase C chain